MEKTPLEKEWDHGFTCGVVFAVICAGLYGLGWLLITHLQLGWH